MGMKPQREQDIVNACLQLLRLRGVLAWRQNSGAFTGEYKGKKRFVQFNGIKGCSDILAVLPPCGRFLAVEAKRPGEKPTPHQSAFLASVEAMGGVAVVVSDVMQLEHVLSEVLGC